MKRRNDGAEKLPNEKFQRMRTQNKGSDEKVAQAGLPYIRKQRFPDDWE